MAGGLKKSQKGEKSANDKKDEKDNEIRQAVLLADSFDHNFAPLTLFRPRCLLNLANVPLIEYTLESVYNAGIDEVFIISRTYTPMIKEYLDDSKWAKSRMKVEVLTCSTAASVGDALRDLDGRSVLRGWFLLVRGDLVTNIKLDKLFEKAVSRADTNNIMTMLMIPLNGNHRLLGERSVVGLDPKTGECLYYEPLEYYGKSGNRIHLDGRLLAERELVLTSDLLDCSVDVCSLQVLALFTENFDYHDIRRDFVRGVLTSEILGHSIYVEVCSEGYACRVDSPRAYDLVSRDLMARWVFPLVPEMNWLRDTNFTHQKNDVYRDQLVSLARSAVLDCSVIVGKGSNVGENTRIRHSVIGQNCKIGKDVSLDGAFVLDGCDIGDGSIIKNSIIGFDVVIQEQVVIQKGCLLGDGVIVGAHTQVPLNSRVATVPFNKRKLYLNKKEFADISNDPIDVSVVGLDGKGYLWDPTKFDADDIDDTEEDEEEEFDAKQECDVVELLKRKWTDLSIGSTLVRDYEESDDDDWEEENDEFVEIDNSNFSNNIVNTTPQQQFIHQVMVLLVHAIERHHSAEHTGIEIHSMKMAVDALHHASVISFGDCCKAIFPVLLNGGSISIPTSTLSGSTLKQIVGKWALLMSRFACNDPRSALQVIVDHMAEMTLKKVAPSFTHLCYSLYENDIIEEEDFVKFYSQFDDPSPIMKGLKDQMKPFIDWLLSAEEEDE